MHPGAARYRQASVTVLSPRETELAAFASVSGALEAADTPAARVRALGRNHDLWSALVKDLAMSGNALPEALKSDLVSLGFWSMAYSTRALLQNLPLAPLIDVNRNIAEGLAAQHRTPEASTSALAGAVTA